MILITIHLATEAPSSLDQILSQAGPLPAAFAAGWPGDGVDAGGLDESWRQQPGTPVYANDFDADGVLRALSEAKEQRTPEWRATANSPGSFTAPA